MAKQSLYDWCIENHLEDLLAEWDSDRNKEAHDKDVAKGKLIPHPASPKDITRGSGTSVFWKCAKGHKFPQSPNGRHIRADGSYAMCNECANELRTIKKRKTRAQKNNLAESIPQAIEEWISSEHNLTPAEVSCHSKEMVHWKCAKGHEFDKRVTDRVYQKDGKYYLHQCFECIKYSKTSIPEQLLFFYIKQVFPDAINPYKDLGVELDIYIPSRQIAIEYDGSYNSVVRGYDTVNGINTVTTSNVGNVWLVNSNGIKSNFQTTLLFIDFDLVFYQIPIMQK